jgi:Stage II sporulation protein E (SpoIIE)
MLALFILAIWLTVRAGIAGAQTRRLERQRAGLLSDVGAMQAALVPEVPRELGGLNVSVAYCPAEGPAAGGDFYDLFMPRPGVVAIMLGDVSGHGHEALTHAALTRYTLRAYLQAGLEPRGALALAGRVLKDPSGERYSTVAVGVYEAAKGTLTYALAGHPPPMLLGLNGLEPVTACSSPPVGWGLPTGRRQTTISLPAGTEACFFSDGLIEARREGQLLGREQLREILTSLGPEPVAEELLEKIRAVAQGTPDDMVACVVSPRATALSGHVHVEELEVDGSTLARAGVRRFLRECSVPPAAIARALAQAAATAEEAGTALLRVEIGPERATVTVSAPSTLATHHGTQAPAAHAARVAELVIA